LPDLQARIQVSLFNILEEGDLQIRGFKLRLPLDIMFVFTANPEDYTNRGAIVTPLKDRIESQILTHYPTTIENSLFITEQEASVHSDQIKRVQASDLVKRLIEQVSFEARNSEFVDKKSGVSARLTIAAYENAVSAAERRALMNKEKETQIWISDLTGIIPSITGKIELVYEGEQEGPYQVAYNLVEKAIRTQFVKYFPNPDSYKKRRSKESVAEENPYKAITHWFDGGNQLNVFFGLKDEDKIQLLYKVDGLYGFVKKHYPNASAKENALLMEFVLHGLSSFSLISKKVLEGKIEFKDLMGSMINLSSQSFSDEELE
jgi:magnesium chelatase subunit I